MAFYDFVYPGASRHDLSPEDFVRFQAIQTYAADGGVNPRPITESVIVDLMRRFGADKAEWYVKCFVGRGFRALYKLQDILDGKEGAEWKPPQEAAPRKNQVIHSAVLDVPGVSEEQAREWVEQHHPGDDVLAHFIFTIVPGRGGRYVKKKGR